MYTIQRLEPARKRPSKSSDPKLKIGSSFCRCSECFEYFRSARAFDRHREGRYDVPGDRGCAPTARMPSVGLQLDPDGVWHFPKKAFSAARRRDLNSGRHRLEVAA